MGKNNFKFYFFLALGLFSFLENSAQDGITSLPLKYKIINHDTIYIFPEYLESKNHDCYVDTNFLKKANLKNGKWCILYAKDTTKMFSLFEIHNGRLLGTCTVFNFINGDPCSRGNYVANKRQGRFLTWDENGKLNEVAHFKDGNLWGSVFRINTSGRVYRKFEWKGPLLINSKKYLFPRKNPEVQEILKEEKIFSEK